MTYSAVNAEKDALIASLRNRIIELEEKQNSVQMKPGQIQSLVSRVSVVDTEFPDQLNLIGTEAVKKFAHLIVEECIEQIIELRDRVSYLGSPPGYDDDSYILGCNDAIGEIEDYWYVE